MKPTVQSNIHTKPENTALSVLQVLPSLKTGGGGVERTTIDIAEAIINSGANAFVASEGGQMVKELLKNGANHITLPLASKNPLTIRNNVKRLVNTIRQNNINIVHARSRAPAWSALSASRICECNFLTTFHGTYNYGTGIIGKMKKYYNSVMTKGEVIIANSEFIARHIINNYGVPESNIRIVPRGIDLEIFNTQKVTEEKILQIKRLWCLDKDSIKILLPGRLTHWKGQSLLIDALYKLKRNSGSENFNVMGLLVGSDQGRSAYKKKLERQIKSLGMENHVKILGHCSDMPTAYALADVVVSASTDPEAFGRVVAEAQAMGKPVIVANHGGGIEQIIPNETGWLFKPGDSQSLSETLQKVIEIEKHSKNRLSSIAINRVKNLYSKTSMCSATLDIYTELRK